jgi:hypothetical protein
MEHVIVHAREPRHIEPSVPCPKCGGINSLMEDWCWRCSEMFGEGQLRAIYEDSLDRP